MIKNLLFGLMTLACSQVSVAASLVIALELRDDHQLIPQILENTSLNSYKYPHERHLTLMWLDNVHPDAALKKTLVDIVNAYVYEKNEAFNSQGGWSFVSDHIGRFGAGGLYLAPTTNSIQMLAELYEQLKNKVYELGYGGHINPHLETFTPHVTLAEASVANSAVPKSKEKVFFDKVKDNYTKQSSPLSNRIVLKVAGGQGWYQ